MISTNNLSLMFDGKALFEEVSINFTQGNCYGVIGANGAGKSTFLKLLSGELDPTGGHVSIQPGKRLSFLKQDHFAFDDYTVLETVIMGNTELYAIMKEKDEIYLKEDFSEADGIRAGELEEKFADMDGWNAETEVFTLLNGLSVDSKYHEEKMSNLPGSDKVKVLLAQAVFGHPDILLLDEPTNHLDLDAINWLEEFVINLDSTVIMVSHDRHFLNKTCTHIADIDYGKIQLFVGNYDFWYESSQLILRQMKDANKKKEEKIKELKDFIDRFSANASKSKQATSRKQALAKINIEDMVASKRRYPFIEFKPRRNLGSSILNVDSLTKTVEGSKVLDAINLTVKNDDKIAFISENELASTTFFELITGNMQPDSGTVHWGSSVEYGYFNKNFDQEFTTDERIVDWLMEFSDEKDETYVRGFLGRMIFAGDDALKKLNVLSGGEKVRCMMSKMMIMGANVLILDEPTNHLDMESITALNNALIKFPGTILMTSHDHQIVDTTATRIVEFKDDGSIVDYLGTYEEYLEKKHNENKK
ncbi:ATP-binding cassette domain-containing protein [Erysipelothrix sp. HDW6C]|uniref:ABC-F family ATP-binding cassette domain-containing protein n=1 Tax=Erysipelothrix sp. HDW6C TaxID=2714930 RepID=UPI001408480F|nr:ATP-binding cassette domain-containing protein [Erysipelothrix sp. HDW6C]QIK70015.1 ATP-binding cassette domain-containing protein [Erysipelothrix sp. HDW6C]